MWGVRALYRKILITAAALLMVCRPAVHAQDISQIAKSDPLVMTGAIGTNNTYFYSSMGGFGANPLSNSVYANLNISLYGLSMPFSFFYANNNTSFSYPQFSFNISPSYKNWTLHIGQRSMPFTSYVFNMSFNGVGLEYKSHKLRAGAFYGTLRKAVNDDPGNPTSRRPQFRRVGYGAKVGYGSGARYIDVYFLNAFDIESSIDPLWNDPEILKLRRMQPLAAQENIVLGAKGHFTIGKHFSVSGNVAASVFSNDVSADEVRIDRIDWFGKVFDTRYSTLARMAGDVGLNLSLSKFNASLTYKIIQPDYKSLGISYISNNMQSLGVNVGGTLAGKVALSAGFAGQSDNLSGNQLYTTKGFVYNAAASMRLKHGLALTASYNGFRQTQSDGTAVLNDSVKVDRIMNSFSIVPSYGFETDGLSHSISVSANLTSNKDLNRFADGKSDVTTYAAGLNYNLGINSIESDISFSYSHQGSSGYDTHYTSDIFSVGSGHSFLKDKSLNVSASIVFCHNLMDGQNRNYSIGADCQMGYTLKEVHVFSFSTSFNQYHVRDYTAQWASGYFDYSMSLNYSYTFTLLRLEKKSKEASTAKTR